MFLENYFIFDDSKYLRVMIDEKDPLNDRLLKCIQAGKVKGETLIDFQKLPFSYQGCAFEDLDIKYRIPFDKPNTMSTKEFQFLGKYLMNEKLFSFHIPRAKIVNVCQVTSEIKNSECFETASLYIPYNTEIKVDVEEE